MNTLLRGLTEHDIPKQQVSSVIVGKDELVKSFKGKKLFTYFGTEVTVSDITVTNNRIVAIISDKSEIKRIHRVLFYGYMRLRSYNSIANLLLSNGIVHYKNGDIGLNMADVVYIPTAQEYINNNILKIEQKYDNEIKRVVKIRNETIDKFCDSIMPQMYNYQKKLLTHMLR